MDIETLRMVIEFLAVPFAGLFFWNFRILRAELREIGSEQRRSDKDLQSYKLHVAEHYATSSDMKALIEAVFKKLDRIEEKLDQKADKT